MFIVQQLSLSLLLRMQSSLKWNGVISWQLREHTHVVRGFSFISETLRTQAEICFNISYSRLI